MDKNYNDNFDGTESFEKNEEQEYTTPTQSSENIYSSSYSKPESTSAAEQNPYYAGGTNHSGAANDNEGYTYRSADFTKTADSAEPSNSYGGTSYNTADNQSASMFNADGSYRRSYSPDNQPSGSYEAGGYSSTRYINNEQTQYGAVQSGARGTTPQSYYTPTQQAVQYNSAKKKNKNKKKGRAGMAVLIAACMLLSAGLGFGGAMLANHLNPTSSGGVNIQKVVETVSTGADGSAMSTEDIVAKTQNSVVEITTESVTTGAFSQNYITQGAGSGVIISENGYIITNNHVIDGAKTIKVTTKDGKSYDAKLVGTASPTLDVALVKINATGLTPAVMGDSDKIKVGEKAVAIGNPLGQLGGTVTEGIISALNRDITVDGTVMNLLQTNAEINPGNSGGGLFDGHGNLIGLVVAKSVSNEIEGIGFAIPINSISDVVSDLTEYGYVKGITETGLKLLDIPNEQTAMMYGVKETGVYVQSVDSRSTAYDAGFIRGDRIVSVEGKEVSTKSEFEAQIKSHKVGDVVSVVVSRDGQKTTLKLELEEYIPESSSSTNGFNEDGNGGYSGNNNYSGGLEDFFNEFFN